MAADAEVARLRAEVGTLRTEVKELRRFKNGLGPALGRMFAEKELKIRALEERQLRFLGVHEPGRQYTVGNLVVRSGGLWHCNVDTGETPGRSNAWQLAVKSGEVNK